MNFYPEDKFPKKGFPVKNGNGEQYELSDNRYNYHDGLENKELERKISCNRISIR
jgi:hypothetical protein